MPTSVEQTLYLDASALVKLVVPEPESAALSLVVADRPVLSSCALARVEVVRAVAPQGNEAVSTARGVLRELDLVQLDDELLDLAAELDGPLRTLDAIHVAAALELGDALEALVTYDARMIDGASGLGLPVLSPV